MPIAHVPSVDGNKQVEDDNLKLLSSWFGSCLWMFSSSCLYHVNVLYLVVVICKSYLCGS